MLKSKLEESEGVTTISENSQIAGSREANSSLIIGREGGLNIITENSDREKYIVLHFYLSTSGKWKIQNNVCWYSRHFAEAKSFFFFESSSSTQNHNHLWHNQQLRSLIVFFQYWRWYKESGTGWWSSIIDRSRAPSRQCQLDHLLCHRRHLHYRNHENHRWFSNHCHHHKSISHPAAIPIFVAPSLVTPSWIWRWSLSLIIIVALLLSSYCHREAISQNKFTSRTPNILGSSSVIWKNGSVPQIGIIITFQPFQIIQRLWRWWWWWWWW